ncbi:MAG: hypothetical protein O9294_14160 [Cytophagales bacterium]|nr:hypothetical protein [Cytophagales bacterium]
MAAIAPLTMRLLTTLLFISLISCGTTPKTNELIGEWIGVSTWKGSGLIFDFKTDNELFIGAIGTDSATTFNYSFNKGNRKLTVEFRGKKEVFGKVEKVTSDQLVIVTDESQKLEFIKIKKTNLKLSKNEIIDRLKNSSWTLTQSDGKIRMDFMSTRRWDDNNQPFEAMFHYWLSTPYKEKEIWNVGEYNGNLFMFFTNHQTEQITQQILEVNPDKMVLASHTSENANQVQVIERTKDQASNVISNLTARRWTSVHMDTTFCHEWGQINIRDTDAKELQLLLKPMEFRFNPDKSYSALLDGQEWRSGQWKTTSDGAYIILDDERNKKNWIEIRQENQNLVLTKLQQIKDGDRDYKLYLLTIRLE